MDHSHHEHEEHIHMPAPSLSPIVLAFGMCFLGFAIAPMPTWLRLTFVVLGILGLLAGLGTWIWDEIRNADHAEEKHE
jgi:hypothetical protein